MLVVVAVASLVTAACGAGDGAADAERLPAIDIVALGGGEQSLLSDIEGPAVINLWATWCPPCRAEIPDFEEVHRARGGEVRFVGINVGEGSARAAEFLDEVGATYDQYLDADGEVSTGLKATTMPLTVVIDANGVVTERHLGPLDQDGLNAAIDEALTS